MLLNNIYLEIILIYVPRPEADGKWYVKYQVIGVNQVAVPTHFFKIVVMETKNGEFHLESYIMPNEPIDDNIPLQKFLVSFMVVFLIFHLMISFSL